MANYARPAFSVELVNSSAKQVAKYLYETPVEELERSRPAFVKAVGVIDNFRAAHAFPLNTFTVTLKNRATSVHGSALTAQRIKRLESIVFKLLNQPDMRLSQMQDIGGCRAILPSIPRVRELRELYISRPLTHQYNGEKDYIVEPKDTGYRGIHLKYRFLGKGKSRHWNGLKVEIQLRTDLQHKWATAVEAAATFTKQALKSNRGSLGWLRFFALMSSVFALREGCASVPGTPNNLDDLRREIRALDDEHFIQSTFAQYRTLMPHIQQQSKAKYFLVTLDPIRKDVKVQGFAKDESRAAATAYTQAETTLPKTTNVVLVSVASISALKRAYPNYFLDTEAFLGEVSTLLTG